MFLSIEGGYGENREADIRRSGTQMAFHEPISQGTAFAVKSDEFRRRSKRRVLPSIPVSVAGFQSDTSPGSTRHIADVPLRPDDMYRAR
jgi:hypothetical protein